MAARNDPSDGVADGEQGENAHSMEEEQSKEELDEENGDDRTTTAGSPTPKARRPHQYGGRLSSTTDFSTALRILRTPVEDNNRSIEDHFDALITATPAFQADLSLLLLVFGLHAAFHTTEHAMRRTGFASADERRLAPMQQQLLFVARCLRVPVSRRVFMRHSDFKAMLLLVTSGSEGTLHIAPPCQAALVSVAKEVVFNANAATALLPVAFLRGVLQHTRRCSGLHGRPTNWAAVRVVYRRLTRLLRLSSRAVLSEVPVPERAPFITISSIDVDYSMRSEPQGPRSPLGVRVNWQSRVLMEHKQPAASGTRVLAVCLPAYNEPPDEIERTRLGILENVAEFQRREKIHLHVVLAYVMDGVSKMAPSTLNYFSRKFARVAFDDVLNSALEANAEEARREAAEAERSKGNPDKENAAAAATAAAAAVATASDETRNADDTPTRFERSLKLLANTPHALATSTWALLFGRLGEDEEEEEEEEGRYNYDDDDDMCDKDDEDNAKAVDNGGGSVAGDERKLADSSKDVVREQKERESRDSNGDAPLATEPSAAPDVPRTAAMGRQASLEPENQLHPFRELMEFLRDAEQPQQWSKGAVIASKSVVTAHQWIQGEDGFEVVTATEILVAKVRNARKHDSHDVFFRTVCNATDPDLVLLTDCGTQFSKHCLRRLIQGLVEGNLAGVTARQRVAPPGRLPLSWTRFLLSPAPLQGYEFEGSVVLHAMFNLIRALPIMPGPCQLLDWAKVKQCRSPEHYLNILYHRDLPEANVLPPPPDPMELPAISDNSVSTVADGDVDIWSSQVTGDYNFQLGFGEIDLDPSSVLQYSGVRDCKRALTSLRKCDERRRRREQRFEERRAAQLLQVASQADDGDGGVLGARATTGAAPTTGGDGIDSCQRDLTMSDYFRLLTRIAEDRVLSFVLAFGTDPPTASSSSDVQETEGGTLWVPSATFYYEAEIDLQVLLQQRRRWINGTNGAFLYLLTSPTGRTLVDGHGGERMSTLIFTMWGMQVWLLLLSFLSPGIMGAVFYNSVSYMELVTTTTFGIHDSVYLVVPALLLYIVWVWLAHTSKNGNFFSCRRGHWLSEAFCWFAVFVGAFYSTIAYVAIVHSGVHELGLVHYTVVAIVLLPFLVTALYSTESARLYLFLYPYFLFFMTFYLVLIPAYAYARLFDTTWGNREGGSDEELTEAQEANIKRLVGRFNVLLVLINVGAAVLGARYVHGNVAVIVLLVIYFPLVIQLGVAFLYGLRCGRHKALRHRASRSKQRKRQATQHDIGESLEIDDVL